jgi:GDP-L-fucose synthase
MKILITGGCGFVGRHLAKRLSQDSSNRITIVDNLSTGLEIENWARHLIMRPERVFYEDCLDFFNRCNETFDVIFHLAAIVEGRLVIENDPFKVANDLIIDTSMFRWAVRTKPRKIVYFSSSAVYPVKFQTKENNFALSEYLISAREEKIDFPDLSYGWAKLNGEFLSNLGVSKHGLNIAVYRPFSGYGEDQAMSYPTPALIKRILTQEEIEVWGSGDQSRDFIYIEDCITGILKTYESISDGSALNLGTGVRTSFKDFIREGCAIIGKEPKIKPLLDKPEGVFARYCDATLQRKYGFVPQCSLREGISLIMDHLKN